MPMIKELQSLVLNLNHSAMQMLQVERFLDAKEYLHRAENSLHMVKEVANQVTSTDAPLADQFREIRN